MYLSLSYSANVKQIKTTLQNWVSPDLLARLRIKPSSGVLIYGPSGCGKSFIMNIILSSQKGISVVPVNCADIHAKYLGESEAKIRHIFNYARQIQPCILLIDNIETIAANRTAISSNSVSSSNVELRILSTLLNELDGIEARNNIYIVASCRDLSLVDQALLRVGRFDQLIHFDLPNVEDIYAILCSELAHLVLSPSLEHDLQYGVLDTTSSYQGGHHKATPFHERLTSLSEISHYCHHLSMSSADVVQVCHHAITMVLSEDLSESPCLDYRHFHQVFSHLHRE